MKVGDLVCMKYIMFWAAQSNKRITYTPVPGVVIQVPDLPGGAIIDSPYAMITVLIGSTKHVGLASEWEMVSEKG